MDELETNAKLVRAYLKGVAYATVERMMQQIDEHWQGQIFFTGEEDVLRRALLQELANLVQERLGAATRQG